MTDITTFRIDSNDNKEVLKRIKGFAESYVETYKDSNFRNAPESLYNSILNIYYSMGIKESQVKRFEPVFFKEHFQLKDNENYSGDEDEFLNPLIFNAPFEIKVFDSPNFVDNDIELERWVGIKNQER